MSLNIESLEHLSQKFFEKLQRNYGYIPYFEKFEDSLPYWKILKNETNLQRIIYECSNIKDDFEVNLPYLFKMNPKIDTFIITIIENINSDIEFDKKHLNNILKDKNLNVIEVFVYEKIILKSPKIDHILEFLKGTTTNKLTLKNTFLTTSSFEFIKNINILDTMMVNRCHFSQDITFESSLSIKKLDIQRSIFNSELGFYDLIKSIENLESLTLLSTNILIDLKILKKLLKRNLESIILGNIIENFNDFIPVLDNVTTKIYFTSKCSKISQFPIFNHLNNSNVLEFVNRDCFYNLEGIEKFLTKNQNIKTLVMSCRDQNIDIGSLLRGLSLNHSITTLDLSSLSLKKNFPDIIQILKDNKSIMELNLSGCDINDKYFDFFGEILSQNTILKKLDIEENFISDDGIKLLLKGLSINRNLKSLSLIGNYFKNDGCLAFKDYLKLNTNLVELAIIDCSYDMEGLKYIFEGLQHNTNLKIFYFDHLPDMEKIVNILFFNTTLIESISYDPIENITKRNRGFIVTNKLQRKHFLNIQFFFF